MRYVITLHPFPCVLILLPQWYQSEHTHTHTHTHTDTHALVLTY